MSDPTMGGLDLLLESTRTDEPRDDLFVQRVMSGVRSYEGRWTRRALRRPMVFGIAAAVLVTGGAVAAVVGTNPKAPRAEVRTAAPSVEAPVKEKSAPVTVSARPRAQAPAPAAPVERKIVETEGFLTDHTAFIIDPESGLRLETETYTNDFVVGKAHRITLTLENTGSKPVSFSAAKDCALQVMAFPDGTNSAPAYQAPEDYTGSFEWVCAGSDADPRTQPFSESFVLRPGDRRIADAYVTLRRPGVWKLAGMCRCTYSRMESADADAPRPMSDPISELLGHPLTAPLLPRESDGENLVTPGIIVRAR